MKKVYLTLFITLLLSMAYIGFAQADSDARSAGNTASQVAKFEPTEWLKDKKFETGDFKVKYSVTEVSKGKYELKADCESGGCAKLKPKFINPKKHDHIPSIIEAAELELKKVFGDSNDNKEEQKLAKAKDSKDKEKRKEQFDNCEIDSSGNPRSADNKAICVEVRIDELLKTGNPDDFKKAVALWNKTVSPQFAKDVFAGKNLDNSWAIKLVTEYGKLSANSDINSNKINLAASSYYEHLKLFSHKMKTEMSQVATDLSLGLVDQARAKLALIQKNKQAYDLSARNTMTVINKGQSQVLSSKLSSITTSTLNLHSGLTKLQSTALAAQKRPQGQVVATPSDELVTDFNVGSVSNSAVESAAGTRATGLSNIGDRYFDRNNPGFRGGHDDGTFDGANLGGLTAPQVNFGSSNSNLLSNSNNPNRNGNTFSNRGQGLRNRPRGG